MALAQLQQTASGSSYQNVDESVRLLSLLAAFQPRKPKSWSRTVIHFRPSSLFTLASDLLSYIGKTNKSVN